MRAPIRVHARVDNVAALRVSSFAHWSREQVHPSVRTKLRKAEKLGLTVDLERFDEKFVGEISDIFNEVSVRQGRPYEHFGKSVAQIESEWNVDSKAACSLGRVSAASSLASSS